jgi:hypothetical protein
MSNLRHRRSGASARLMVSSRVPAISTMSWLCPCAGKTRDCARSIACRVTWSPPSSSESVHDASLARIWYSRARVFTFKRKSPRLEQCAKEWQAASTGLLEVGADSTSNVLPPLRTLVRGTHRRVHKPARAHRARPGRDQRQALSSVQSQACAAGEEPRHPVGQPSGMTLKPSPRTYDSRSAWRRRSSRRWR